MVADRDAVRAKYDATVSDLLQREYVPDDQPVPLVLIATREGLDAVSSAVLELGGSVRHVIPPLSSVGAWVPKSSIALLAQRADVLSIEFDHPVGIA